MMECPTCRAEIEGRPGLCPLCGSELPVEREVNRCPACGGKAAEGAETCDMCGAVLVEKRGTSYLLVAIESLLVVLAVVVLLGSIWLLRPQQTQPSAGPPPTPIPTSTPTPTRPPRTSTPTVTSTPTITPTPLPPFITHTVQAGDTLLGIAAEYGTTVEAIVAASGLSGPEELLQIGQELRVPLQPEAMPPPSTPTSAPAISPTPLPPFTTHTVQAGDTLLDIAAEYGTTVEAIVAASGLSGPQELLRIGQELRIPLPPQVTASGPTATPPPVTGIITHTVEAGDTLYFLAIKYGTTVEAIMEANGITDPKGFLQVGQPLIVPAGMPALASASPPPIMTATPTNTPWPALRPTASTSFPYPAPILLGPPDGSLLQGEPSILLNWASVGLLAKDEWYLVRVHCTVEGETEELEEWSKATSWRLPPSLCSTSEEAHGLYQWDVVVMRRAEAGEDAAISLRSETRSFLWAP